MKIETTPRDDHQIQIQAELEPEVFEGFKHQAARKIAMKTKVPGFRPGKAPYDVIRRIAGDEAIVEQAVELMLDEVYPKIIDESKINASGPGSLEKVVSLDPPVFSFIVPLAPVVELGDYRSMRQEYAAPVITDEDVEKVMNNLRKEMTSSESVDRPAESGDLVRFVIEGVYTQPKEGEDNVAFKKMTQSLMVGESEFEQDDWPFEGFTALLIGLSAKEEKVITHTFAEDDEDENLRGREVEFTLNVLFIRKMTVPALDDELAKSMGDFENVATLRAAVLDQLQHTRQHDYDDEYMSSLIDQVVEASVIKYPPTVLEEEIESVQASFEERLSRNKMDLATYLKTVKKEKDVFVEEELKPVARKRLERGLVIDELAHAENLQLDMQELQTAVFSQLNELGQNNAEFRKLPKRQVESYTQTLTIQTANRMMSTKAFDRLKAIATGQAEAEPAIETIEPTVEISDPVVESAETAETVVETAEPAESES